MAGEVNQGGCFDAVGAERVCAAKVRQVDQELRLRNHRAGLVEQADRGAGGAAGGDQVVDQ